MDSIALTTNVSYANPTTEIIFEASENDAFQFIIPAIILYGRICVWIIGTVCNILAFLVFSRKGMSNSVSGSLFKWLAVFDFIVVQEYIQGWLRVVGVDLYDYFDWTCKIAFWIFHSAKIISVWIIVAIGFERLIGIVWPLRTSSITSGKIYLLVLIFLSLVVNSFHNLGLVTVTQYDYILKRQMWTCQYYPPEGSFFYNYIHDIRPWVMFLAYSGIPFILILCINAAIIIALIHRQRLIMVR